MSTEEIETAKRYFLHYLNEWIDRLEPISCCPGKPFDSKSLASAATSATTLCELQRKAVEQCETEEQLKGQSLPLCALRSLLESLEYQTELQSKKPLAKMAV